MAAVAVQNQGVARIAVQRRKGKPLGKFSTYRGAPVRRAAPLEGLATYRLSCFSHALPSVSRGLVSSAPVRLSSTAVAKGMRT
jgi:hypothetical protein